MNDVRTGYFAGAGGTKLYYEDVVTGPPIVFCHGFAGDHRSW